mmetsp:Transcript_28655/g.61128  ORF Transcript_28655/g.61128 Transcript_28655/m.61128 type:complete len:460 (+) Transcript_28655:85-1464(+)|eukprot:CAMPEP_0172320356 /NCGR_PEP_ID=MMETSP1058-20130122/40366_1 /TAXON_ID=83371 /ORGANISM="Detonula confervacea, Strain CCMP 353" /LENGTH=459 /DNA_ID=CAMNT_0013035611 /DNA_START=60 /DNA_END=1439 /DNA_ORIENTATION=+
MIMIDNTNGKSPLTASTVQRWRQRQIVSSKNNLALLPSFMLLLALMVTVPLSIASPAFALRSSPKQHHEHPRAAFIATGISSFGAMVLQPAFALENNSNSRLAIRAAASTTDATGINRDDGYTQSINTIIYQPLSINVDGVQVPVAAWHSNVNSGGIKRFKSNISYEHRISVSKIGKALAGWKLPSFIDRNFSLQPTSFIGSNNIRIASYGNDEKQQLPQSAPVVLLAHGYLGSRFDLSHLGQALASQGFLVLAPEYPESLAASYDAAESTSGIPIDRTIITDQLLRILTEEWNVQPTSYGIVGHSLGCGTVDKTGDDTWTRVCLAGGYPSTRGPNCLFIGSINDGAVSVRRAVDALREYKFKSLDEQMVRLQSWNTLPSRAFLIFTNPSNAPNHISFLTEGTNDAMVEFLSPLLPLARALGIPVLDFDKYQVSRDSKATGEVVIPLVVDYMKQMMRVS